MTHTPDYEEIDLEVDNGEEALEPLTPEDVETMVTRLEAMTKLHDQFEADVKKLASFIEELPAIFKREKELMDYYYSDWNFDYEHADELPEGKHFGITSEDTIWNTMCDANQSALAILKLLINHIAPEG